MLHIGEKTVSQRIAKVFDGETPFKSGFFKTFNVSYAQTDVVPVKVNKSDFQTLNLGQTSTAFKAGREHYSFDGWKLLTGAVVGPTTFTDGSLKDLALSSVVEPPRQVSLPLLLLQMDAEH